MQDPGQGGRRGGGEREAETIDGDEGRVDVDYPANAKDRQRHRAADHGEGGSSSRSGAGAGAGAYPFKCRHAGCGKAFTRKDHLARHAANHDQTNIYCPTCSRPFKRLDLLQRHQKRQVCQAGEHASPQVSESSGNAVAKLRARKRRKAVVDTEKDIMAGNTMSLDRPAGNQAQWWLNPSKTSTTLPAQPHPTSTTASADPGPSRTIRLDYTSSSSSSTSDEDRDDDGDEGPDEISSQLLGEESPFQVDISGPRTIAPSFIPTFPLISLLPRPPDDMETLAHRRPYSSWDNHAHPSSSGVVLPYSALPQESGVFTDRSPLYRPPHSETLPTPSPAIVPSSQTPSSLHHINLPPPISIANHTEQLLFPENVSHPERILPMSSVSTDQPDFLITDSTWGFAAPFAPEAWEPFLNDSLAPPFGEPFGETPRFDFSTFEVSQLAADQSSWSLGPDAVGAGPSIGSTNEPRFGDGIRSDSEGGPGLLGWADRMSTGSRGTFLAQESAERVGLQSAGGGGAQPPLVKEEVIKQTLVDRLKDGYPDADIDLPFLTESLKLYWSEVSPTFPFIHRGTFDIDGATSELILMMAIVGSMHMPPPLDATSPVQKDFRRVAQRIRGVLVQDCGLDMPIPTIQAFCLCHVYDTWYGTSETLFIAQCMWPVMVAHSRKKGIGVMGKSDMDAQEEVAWAAWAKDEERRRSAFCVLLLDTQLSAFWNQHVSRQLSIFAHNISLPCPRTQWDALTAREWFRAGQPPVSPTPRPPLSVSRKPRLGYLPGLHPEFQVSGVSEGYSSAILSALAAEEKLPFRVHLDDALTVEMVIMGLMAIAWDCRTRSGMGIRFKEGVKHWRSIVINAVIHLRAAWEDAVQHITPCTETRDMRDTFAISIISVLSDIPMLQVTAGETTVCGASIGTRQYADAKRRLKLWGKTDDAWTCLWQSARFLRQALFSDWGIYTPWAVYLTTLVVWAYASTHLPAQSPRQVDIRDSSSDSKQGAISLLDDILTSDTRMKSIKSGLADLIVSAARLLESISMTKGAPSFAGRRASPPDRGRRSGAETMLDKELAGVLWGLLDGVSTNRRDDKG